MFEITGDDLQKLDDSELRTLVARLAIAELRASALPIVGVTAGGDQNAPDGGLDVRVESSVPVTAGNFVPRVPLGFQVKKPDIASTAISNEMRPNGVLRPVIGELADLGGAYVIVSSQGSVADKPLQKRRKAMSDALDGHPSATKLHVDFYDRERLAAWVNQFPGVAAWARMRVGRPLAGWQALGDWSGTRVGGDGKFISDDAACLIDARAADQTVLPIIDGIECIRRALLEPGQCVRLIGMSGFGKTRLIQALFESDVGADPLDPSLAVYTDYTEAPEPTAKQLALQLVETGQRCVLVVDNCNPQTHSDLAKICGSQRSKVSLITVEYDVRDDEPERTEVFRLQAASAGIIEKWLETNFSHVSQVDRDRIAEFSGGNFRVAGVLAETIKKGESLGDLRDRDLFSRIFQQRNDASESLLRAAEALALVYSFDGENTSSGGELELLASVAGSDVTQLYEAVAELTRRSVIQSRGRWRAILPHAIANRLAAQALERIPPDQFDAFCAGLPPRMQKSLSRRLGYLHDKSEAQQAVARWLKLDGPLGDLIAADDHSLEVLRNIAPVAPDAVLRRIEGEITGSTGSVILDPKFPHRWQLTSILKSLAYDAALFNRAARALVGFVAAENPTENHNSAKGSFEELFQLYLSGTHATPRQRRALVKALFRNSDPALARCGMIALKTLLKSSHFSAASNFDFGARPRDFGWHPATYGDIWDWHNEAIALAVELSKEGQRQEIKRSVSGELRGILAVPACLDAIDGAITEFISDGEWLDGWFAVRAALRFDGDGWQPDVKERVQSMEARLRPSEPLNEARAYVIEARGSGFDFMDGEADEDRDYSRAWERAAQRAQSIGRAFGEQHELLRQFLPEVLQSEQAARAFSFGLGLAECSTPLTQTWQTLCESLISLPFQQRNATVLGGFLQGVQQIDPALSAKILNDALGNAELSAHFVYLQASAGIDAVAISRLRRAIGSGINPRQFYSIASGVIRGAPQDELAAMLDELSILDGGTAASLEILHMAFYCLKDDGEQVQGSLLDVGHKLLSRTDYKNTNDVREHRIQQMIRSCYAGPSGEQGARDLCHHLKQQIADRRVYAWQLDHVFDAIFEVQPLIALDEFMLGQLETTDDPIYGGIGLTRRSPLEKVPSADLWDWAETDPSVRYPLIGRSLHIFAVRNHDEDAGISPRFLEALQRSPDREQFLKSNADRLHPSGWSGHLSVILDMRREMLTDLLHHEDPSVEEWARNQSERLKNWADAEREREVQQEESFE
jgi:hypothetical protein